MTNPFTEDGHVDFIQLWAWGTAITARDKRDALTVVLIHNEKPVRARWREWGKGSLGGGRKGCSGEISKLCCACRLPHSQSCHGQHAARYLGLGQSAAFSTRWFKLVYVISSVGQHGQWFLKIFEELTRIRLCWYCTVAELLA